MTRKITDDDKILNMYQQYNGLLIGDGNLNYEVAAQLTLAHMMDHMVCLLKDIRDEVDSRDEEY